MTHYRHSSDIHIVIWNSLPNGTFKCQVTFPIDTLQNAQHQERCDHMYLQLETGDLIFSCGTRWHPLIPSLNKNLILSNVNFFFLLMKIEFTVPVCEYIQCILSMHSSSQQFSCYMLSFRLHTCQNYFKTLSLKSYSLVLISISS